MNLARIQQALHREKIDCWLIYDFQGTSPTMAQFLADGLMLTRRLFLLIPAQGEPVILGSKIDNDSIQSTTYTNKVFYVSWQEMTQLLAELLAGYQVIGMDYSPNGELPAASRVDAGTVDMIRNLGKTVVSAANVFQAAVAVWSEAVLEAHREDARLVATIKDEAFHYIASQLRQNQALTEYAVQSFIMQRFAEANLITPHGPIVAVNRHSSDPHYAPTADKHAPIRKGDWVLIDLWAKRAGTGYVYADITWVAYAGPTPSPEQQAVFKIVAEARDTAVAYIKSCHEQNIAVEGWQVDEVTRAYLSQAGYGQYFFHRTGHSLSPGHHIHGMGVNIDNLETHDTRRLIPGIGFSIEPGIYLPDFGVRLEIDVFMADHGPLVTTPLQQEIICLPV
jgi:Xaa-Pro aminopeptidase